MDQYSNIFFDLDHTLWDFDKNCSETLEELFHLYNLNKLDINVDSFVNTFKKVNREMWQLINSGKATKEIIREKRFRISFQRLGLQEKFVPGTINEDFMKLCPTKCNLIPHAHETLQYLRKKYSLFIITNGFIKTQKIKIDKTDLAKYFKTVIDSDSCGYFKPDKRIFLYALQLAKAFDCSKCVMVGDDLNTDIKGARNAGLNTIYFNPEKTVHQEKTTYEISCLSELTKIL